MMRLDGKVGIVTGAATGIGLAGAEALAREGASVVLCDVDAERGAAAAQQLRDGGARALFVEADVSVDEEVAAMVAEAVDAFGGLDLAFNNAGIEGALASTHVCTLENWTRTLSVNLTGVWSAMHHELPYLLERGGGSIVNTASIAGLVGFAGAPAYTASKHGIVGLTKAAALEYATLGIRVNAVCPGFIDTEMADRLTGGNESLRAAAEAQEPMGRFGDTSEIADAVVWLCSDESSFVTGQAIAIDGGYVTG